MEILKNGFYREYFQKNKNEKDTIFSIFLQPRGNIMKKVLLASIFAGLAISAMAAYQYEHKGNQGWLTFDSETTVAFDLVRSGKDKDHENFIDRGKVLQITAGIIWIPGKPVLSVMVFPQHSTKMTALVSM